MEFYVKRTLFSILLFTCLLSCNEVTNKFNYRIETNSNQPYVFFHCDQLPGQKWRLWIPEVFNIQNDKDRHFDKIDSVMWRTEGEMRWFETEVRESDEYAVRFKIEVLPTYKGIQLKCTVQNKGSKPWGEIAHPAFCLSSEEASDFHRGNGDRTYIRPDRSWKSIHRLLGEIPIKKVYNAPNALIHFRYKTDFRKRRSKDEYH